MTGVIPCALLYCLSVGVAVTVAVVVLQRVHSSVANYGDVYTDPDSNQLCL